LEQPPRFHALPQAPASRPLEAAQPQMAPPAAHHTP
jgi:hypothetical protein